MPFASPMQRQRAKALRCGDQFVRRADHPCLAPDIGKIHFPARNDRRRGNASARRRIEHKAEHAGRRSKSCAETLVTVRQGRRKARQVAASETGAELPCQRCRRMGVGVLEQDIDGDDGWAGLCDGFDKARDGLARPRPRGDGVEAVRIDIDDDDARRRRRLVHEARSRAKHKVAHRLDGTVEQALRHEQERGDQHGGRHDAAEQWRHRCQTSLNHLSFQRCGRGPPDRRTNGRMCGRSRPLPRGCRAPG